MKKLLLLLVLVAGGLAAASLTVPSNAAVVNGQAISENQLNSDVSAIANNPNYSCYLHAEAAVASQGQSGLPSVDGVEPPTLHNVSTSAFVASYLNTEIGHQIVSELAQQHHVDVTQAELRTARQQFGAQINQVLNEVSGSSFECAVTTSGQVLANVPTSLIQQNVQFDATIAALEKKVGGVGSSTQDLRKFFDSNRSVFDQVCFTAATFASSKDAQAARSAVYEGGSFTSIASKTTGGGPQGCYILYGVISQLPTTANVQGLPLNTLSDPIALNNGEYVILELTARSPNSFTTARSEVQQAVGTVQANQVRVVIAGAQQHAHVSVNPRYGAWKASLAQVLMPPAPGPNVVINAPVNSPSALGSSSPGGTSSGSAGSG
jgi:hypothetical protein